MILLNKTSSKRVYEEWKEGHKKQILNWCGFRFSRQRRPLSSYRVHVVVEEVI